MSVQSSRTVATVHRTLHPLLHAGAHSVAAPRTVALADRWTYKDDGEVHVMPNGRLDGCGSSYDGDDTLVGVVDERSTMRWSVEVER